MEQKEFLHLLPPHQLLALLRQTGIEPPKLSQREIATWLNRQPQELAIRKALDTLKGLLILTGHEQ